MAKNIRKQADVSNILKGFAGVAERLALRLKNVEGPGGRLLLQVGEQIARGGQLPETLLERIKNLPAFTSRVAPEVGKMSSELLARDFRYFGNSFLNQVKTIRFSPEQFRVVEEALGKANITHSIPKDISGEALALFNAITENDEASKAVSRIIPKNLSHLSDPEGFVKFLREAKDPQIMSVVSSVARAGDFSSALTTQASTTFQKLRDFVGQLNEFIAKNKQKFNDTHIATINEKLKKGQYEDVVKYINGIDTIKGSGTNAAELTGSLNALKTENTNLVNLMRELEKQNLIHPSQVEFINKSLTTLEVPGIANLVAGSRAGKATAVAGITSLVGSISIGELFGKTYNTINTNRAIISEIVSKLNGMKGNSSVSGRSWEDIKKEVINNLSGINSIQIDKYKNVDPAKVPPEIGLAILADYSGAPNGGNFPQKFESITKGYQMILSEEFNSVYESGYAGITQSVGEALDTANILSGLTGTVSDINQLKTLANKGLQAITEGTGEISTELQKMIPEVENLSQTIDAFAGVQPLKEAHDSTNIRNNFIESLQYIKVANQYKEHDRMTFGLKKNAQVFEVAGEVLGIAVTMSEVANIISKGILYFEGSWKNLKNNVEDVEKYLVDFLGSTDKSKKEAAEFIGKTNSIISKLKEGIQAVETNYPFDLEASEKQLTEEEAKVKLQEVKAKGKNLQAALNGLNQIIAGYNEIGGEDSEYYKLFDAVAESYLHSAVEVAEALTFLSGKPALSTFSRLLQKKNKGLAIANALKSNINIMLNPEKSAKEQPAKNN